MATVFTLAQTPKLDWAKTFGSAYDDFGNAIAVDASGNVYTTGVFTDTADFDPGIAIFNLKTSGGGDIFISKLDAAGKFVWAKKIGGTMNDAPYAIALDAIGNVYITGGFIGTVDFDPGTGTKILTSASTTVMDIFITKFDPAGNLTWAKSIGGILTDYVSSIAIDAFNNVYTTGLFYSTVDFDPDPAVTVNLSSKGNSEIFILKLDVTGKFVWAKSIGSSSADAGRSVAVDASSNVYTTGSFSGTADFDPGLTTSELTAKGYTDIFVLKLDGSGNFVWAKNMGGSSDEEGSSIIVSSAGITYTIGRFLATADFDPGTGTSNLTSLGDKDIFILKLDAYGNFSWVKQLGGLLTDLGLSIAMDATGNIYTTGSFKGTADFDPGTAKSELTSSGVEDVFISKLDPSGNFVWAKRIGSTLNDIGQSITVAKSTGTIYLTGTFAGTVDFDPDAPKVELMSVGITDIFVEKILANSVSVKTIEKNNITIYPNPNIGILNIDFKNMNSDKIEIRIFNSIGQIVMEENLIQDSPFTIQHLKQGVYFVKVMSDNNILAIQKIIKN